MLAAALWAPVQARVLGGANLPLSRLLFLPVLPPGFAAICEQGNYREQPDVHVGAVEPCTAAVLVGGSRRHTVFTRQRPKNDASVATDAPVKCALGHTALCDASRVLPERGGRELRVWKGCRNERGS